MMLLYWKWLKRNSNGDYQDEIYSKHDILCSQLIGFELILSLLPFEISGSSGSMEGDAFDLKIYTGILWP